MICSRWHRPQTDLFTTRFNNKLPLFVLPVPDPLVSAVDALSLPWEDLDAYTFPPAAILVEKAKSGGEVAVLPMQENHSDCPRVAQHVLVLGSSGHVQPNPTSLPNLLTQSFNQIPHRNLTNLNLHAWLLDVQQSRSRASLRQWQWP